MRLVALLVLLAGCPAGGDDYPVIPGGPSNPTSPMVDARVADGALGDGASLVGRVCLVTDLRKPTTGCAASGAGGIAVQLGTASTTTAGDGTFTIVPPAGTGLVWRLSGTDLVPSVIPLTTAAILPVVARQTYLDLSNQSSVIVNSGEGSVFLYVVGGGVPVADATVTSMPVASYPAMGDRATATTWVPGGTGAFGASWTPGIIAGTTRLEVTVPDDVVVKMIDVPIEDGSITFATLAIL